MIVHMHMILKILFQHLIKLHCQNFQNLRHYRPILISSKLSIFRIYEIPCTLCKIYFQESIAG